MAMESRQKPQLSVGHSLDSKLIRIDSSQIL